MFDYRLPEQKPKLHSDSNIEISSRTRVLGFIPETNSLLYSVATPKKTEIQLVDPKGLSTVVISFNKYMDIITADLSLDKKMILYTERIITTTSNESQNANSNYINTDFKYELVFCNLHSFAQNKVFTSALPIASYFLPNIESNCTKESSDNKIKNLTNQISNAKSRCKSLHSFFSSKSESSNASYQFIHIIGNKVKHFRTAFKNQKILVNMVSNGININNCSKWFLSKQNSMFYSFNDGIFIAYNFNHSNSKAVNQAQKPIISETYQYSYDPASTLPLELALHPSTLTNHPYYRFSSGISYVLKFISRTPGHPTDYGVIEQLYQGEESSLAFSVATICGGFKKIVEVPNVASDLPISFYSPSKGNHTSVFVFVPNSFITLIDFSLSPPHISMMPRVFSESIITSKLGTTIDFDTRFIIDIQTSKLYELSMNIQSFPESLHYANRTILSIIARLIAMFPLNLNIPSAIDKLPSEITSVQYFFKSLFSIANHIKLSKISLPDDNDLNNQDIINSVFSELPNNLFSQPSRNDSNEITSDLQSNGQGKIAILVPAESQNSLISISSNSSEGIIFNNPRSEETSSPTKTNSNKISSETMIRKTELMSYISNCLQQWNDENHPNLDRAFSIALTAAFEAKEAKMPDVIFCNNTCLKHSLLLCPLPIRHTLSLIGFSSFPNSELLNDMTNSHDSKILLKSKTIKLIKKEESEISYWKQRLSFIVKDNINLSRNSSSSFHIKKTRSYSNYGSPAKKVLKIFTNKEREIIDDHDSFGMLNTDGIKKTKTLNFICRPNKFNLDPIYSAPFGRVLRIEN